MEAPLHQSAVPLPPPPQDAALLLLRQAAARAMVGAQKQPAAVGRERCPRCASRDTKFCYYNNYNTAQPRHFCRACRRYWTLGGSLRNVPVGGSTRKRPRPPRLTHAIAMAATAVAAAAATTTTTACSPFASSPIMPPAPSPGLQVQGGLLGSPLLLGSASPLLALGAAPLLEGRLGGLGFGQPAALLHGAGPLLWPPEATVLEGDRALFPLPPAAALWQDLAPAAPPVDAGGLHQGCSPHLLL